MSPQPKLEVREVTQYRAVSRLQHQSKGMEVRSEQAGRGIVAIVFGHLDGVESLKRHTQ